MQILKRAAKDLADGETLLKYPIENFEITREIFIILLHRDPIVMDKFKLDSRFLKIMHGASLKFIQRRRVLKY